MNTLTLGTGVSDHHKLIGTLLRSKFAKDKPKKYFRFAPIKTSVVQNNNQLFMTKVLCKVVMKRSKSLIRKKMPKIGPIANNKEIIAQKEFKTCPFNNLNVKDVTENKRF